MEENIKEIVELKNKGFGSRYIASKLGISKSTVNKKYNDFYAKKKPKVLFLDLETSAAEVLAFDRWEVTVTEDHVLKQGGRILVAGWKWQGENKIHSIAMTPREIKNNNDERVVSKVYQLFNEADIVVMHNGDKFDKKMLANRVAFYGGDPIAPRKTIDTLKIVKKHFKLPSNSLDSICSYFGIGRKKPSSIVMWKNVQAGSKEAMKQMQEYCETDIELLEAVFDKVYNLGYTGINVNLYDSNETVRCKVCGSEDLQELGYVYTVAGKYKEYGCNDCGASNRSQVNELSKGKRKSLLK